MKVSVKVKDKSRENSPKQRSTQLKSKSKLSQTITYVSGTSIIELDKVKTNINDIRLAPLTYDINIKAFPPNTADEKGPQPPFNTANAFRSNGHYNGQIISPASQQQPVRRQRQKWLNTSNASHRKSPQMIDVLQSARHDNIDSATRTSTIAQIKDELKTLTKFPANFALNANIRPIVCQRLNHEKMVLKIPASLHKNSSAYKSKFARRFEPTNFTTIKALGTSQTNRR